MEQEFLKEKVLAIVEEADDNLLERIVAVAAENKQDLATLSEKDIRRLDEQSEQIGMGL